MKARRPRVRRDFRSRDVLGTNAAAFSLLEMMFVLGLVALMLVVLGSLFSQFNRALHHSYDKDTALQAALDTFTQVGDDLTSAVNITSPVNSTWATSITLKRLWPYATFRYPSPPQPNPPSYTPTFNAPLVWPNWAPDPSSTVTDVVYTFAAPTLTRTGVKTTLASEGLSAFNCRIDPNSAIDADINVTIIYNGVAQSVTHTVALHQPPGGMDP